MASTSSSCVLPLYGAADVTRRYGVAHAASKACVCSTQSASRSGHLLRWEHLEAPDERGDLVEELGTVDIFEDGRRR